MPSVSITLSAVGLLALFCQGVLADDPGPQIETILIRGAEFTMGTPIQSGRHGYHKDEALVRVAVRDFRIGKYPVTATEMCTFLNSEFAKAYDRRALYNHGDVGDYVYSTISLGEDGVYVPRQKAAAAPANQVTWKGAVLFCEWLSGISGKIFRLPTEAEWELAARGKELRDWPWGNTSATQKHGFRYDRKNRKPTWTTARVGSYPANATPDGVHDMLAYLIGEWCANKYGERPTASQMVDARCDLADLVTHRVVRGYIGGRTWTRVHVHPIDEVEQAARHGFRVVEDVENASSPLEQPDPIPDKRGRLLKFSLAVTLGIVVLAIVAWIRRARNKKALVMIKLDANRQISMLELWAFNGSISMPLTGWLNWIQSRSAYNSEFFVIVDLQNTAMLYFAWFSSFMVGNVALAFAIYGRKSFPRSMGWGFAFGLAAGFVFC